MLLATGLLLAVLASEPIGELTEQEFLTMLAQQGFTTVGNTKVSNPDGSFALQLGFSNSSDKKRSIVGSARAIVAFDTPRAVPTRQLTTWLAKEGFKDITVVSLLSGKVRFEVLLATPQSTPVEVVSQARKLQTVQKQFVSAFAASQPKESQHPYRQGPAKYDPEAVMLPVHVEDTDFIIAHFGWNKFDKPLALMKRGSLVQIEGVAFGVHPVPQGLVMVISCAPDTKKVERYLRNPQTIKWAEAQIERGWVSFVQRHQFETEVKAKDVAQIIEQFGRNIKALDLL